MEKICQCAIETHVLLKGDMYREANYQRVLVYYLQKEGFVTSTEEVCTYRFGENQEIYAGSGRMDIVCYKDGKQYILELKVGSGFKMKEYMAQLRKYVKHRRAKLGILIIFDSQKSPVIEKYERVLA